MIIANNDVHSLVETTERDQEDENGQSQKRSVHSNVQNDAEAYAGNIQHIRERGEQPTKDVDVQRREDLPRVVKQQAHLRGTPLVRIIPLPKAIVHTPSLTRIRNPEFKFFRYSTEWRHTKVLLETRGCWFSWISRTYFMS